MRSRATFLLLLIIALPCLSVSKSSEKMKISPAASKGGASLEKSNPPMLPAPPTTESTIQEIESAVSEVVDDIESAVKKTVLPSDPNAFGKVEMGASPTLGPPGTSIDANASNDTTEGIVPAIESLFNPLAQGLYLFIDSLLRAYKGKALPCLITSWVPLEGTCTPLISSPNTNQPVPATS